MSLLQTQVYATAGNPKTPEIEVMDAPGEPNEVTRQLALGGVCAFDDNLKILEAELNTKFSDPVVDSLRNATYAALNESAIASTVANANDDYEGGSKIVLRQS